MMKQPRVVLGDVHAVQSSHPHGIFVAWETISVFFRTLVYTVPSLSNVYSKVCVTLLIEKSKYG